MRITKQAIFVFIFSWFVGVMSAQGLLIVPSNVTPEPVNCIVNMLSGGLLSFDLVISNPQDISAQGFQSVTSVSGPGVLTGNQAGSISVATNPNYWIYGNSAGAVFIDNGDNSYTFGDNPDNGLAETLLAGDIMARYAFIWDGTIGWYTFTIDIDPIRSFYLNEFFSKQPFSIGENPQMCSGDSPNSFKLYIPEPSTLILIGLGNLVLLRRRRA